MPLNDTETHFYANATRQSLDLAGEIETAIIDLPVKHEATREDLNRASLIWNTLADLKLKLENLK